MYFNKSICVVSAMLATSVRLAATMAPISGYDVVPFTWEVEISPDGSKENFTGTVQEVVAQLSAIKPDWKSDFNNSEPELVERDLSNPWTKVLCNIRLFEWGLAYRRAISNEINYLNGVLGTPVNGPGPGACGRVSCEYKSAIWWCNDETETFSLPRFSTIATGASTILGQCRNINRGNLNGQVFAQSPQNWNVIVRGGNC